MRTVFKWDTNVHSTIYSQILQLSYRVFNGCKLVAHVWLHCCDNTVLFLHKSY